MQLSEADAALAAALRRSAQSTDDAFLQILRAAGSIVRHFLGQEFADGKVNLSKTPDSFMLNEFDEASENRFAYMHRVISLADFLFELRNSPGFGVLVRRFQTRETRQTFYEAMIASHLHSAGMIVNIRTEKYVRQQDFDFDASRGNESLNVEVTACTNPQFSEKISQMCFPKSENSYRRTSQQHSTASCLLIGLKLTTYKPFSPA